MADYPRSMDMLRRLVSMDTTSRNSNLELIDFVRDHLDQFGIASELVPDATGKKANLYATIGPTDRPGICLSGHTDVVPIDGQDWSTDPWTITEQDGLLHGRGTCDMKGFVAVALTWVEAFARGNLKTPVHLLLSYDEEVGCLGVRGALAELKRCADQAQGRHHRRADRDARDHRAQGQEERALPRARPRMPFLADAQGRQRDRICRGGHRPSEVDGPALRRRGAVRSRVRRALDHGSHRHRPGGTALNIVPKDCRFDFEFRYLPGVDPEALYDDVRAFAETLVPEMKAVTPDAGFSWSEISAFPGLDTPEDAEIVVLAKALAQANATVKVAFGTEAGLIQEAGMPAIVCGPGSIEQAHKPNEFVAISQLAQCEAFMDRLLARLKA